ncbi:LytTR family DNA-binding domain-containing protein [Sphingobacterium sp. KU25419]|nr:LytTR family DNA-binding domain-containing protein [Sphingobacterium sp. KU25419]
MNRIKTVIIEDEPLARGRLQKLLNKFGVIEVVGVFENPIKAIELLKKEKVDLLFSDIDMPEMNGIDFLKSLVHRPLVIFITAHYEYAVDGFELEVIDYILKPLMTEERLLKAVDKVQKAILLSRGMQEDRKAIKIKDRNKTIFIDPSEIFYIKAWGDYIQIYCEEGVQTLLCTMKEMETALPWNMFSRMHRSFIVNIKQIKGVEASKVILKNGTELSIGLQYRNQLFAKMDLI